MSLFLKPDTVKDVFKKTHKIRSTDSAVKQIVTTIDDTITHVLADSAKAAKTARRNTVMDEDVAAAIEKHLAKRNLSWDEATQEVIRQTPADLGKISKAIQDYITSGGNKQKLLEIITQVKKLFKP